MRKGFGGLALLVQQTLKREPHSGHLFVLRGRSGGLIKVLWHDGQGMCLFAIPMERGRFIWSRPWKLGGDHTGAARLSARRRRLAPPAAQLVARSCGLICPHVKRARSLERHTVDNHSRFAPQ